MIPAVVFSFFLFVLRGRFRQCIRPGCRVLVREVKWTLETTGAKQCGRCQDNQGEFFSLHQYTKSILGTATLYAMGSGKSAHEYG